jgi:hypothetical protein
MQDASLPTHIEHASRASNTNTIVFGIIITSGARLNLKNYHSLNRLQDKGKLMTQVTLGFSVHRPEMTPLIHDCMRRHDAIFLEEPPEPGFAKMLAGRLSVDEYLLQLDAEYPAFSRKMCYLLRELNAEGKAIFQVEPFMEILLSIHAFFAEGHRPAELQKNAIQYPVYLVEKNASRALLAYYQTVMAGSFDETIAAITEFARMDAARFRLRDSLRAQEIAPMAAKYTSSYVEAGVMHFRLRWFLGQQLFKNEQIDVIFLADNALQSRGQYGRLYGPGDQLTFLYIFHPKMHNTRRAKVLAARSIIYSKIVVKEELTGDLNTFPHLRDELDCILMTRRLSLDDCRRLFPLVRRANSIEARKIVGGYLADLMPQPDRYLQPA